MESRVAETDQDAVALLTRAGGPFELLDVAVGGIPMRGFRRAEAGLASLFAGLQLHAEKIFVIDGDRSLTYAEFSAAAARLATDLAARGVMPGERVALAMRNCVEWMAGFTAIVACGAIPALVNSRGSAKEMADAIDLVGATLILADDRRAVMLADGGVPLLVPVLDVSPGGPRLPMPTAQPDDPAMILFTSGTTGRAKGATLTHRAAMTGLLLTQMAGAMIGIRMMGAAALAGPRPQSVTLLAFPLFHVSGCHSIFLAGLASGGRVVVAPKWDAPTILRLIEREGVTNFSGSPTMVWDLIQSREEVGADLSSLVSVSTGGQAQPVNLLDAVVSAFPRAVVGTGFGATETSGAIAMHTGADYLSHPKAAGQILPLAEIRIRDVEGVEVPAGTAGEIVVRGPMVMAGYWNDDQATEHALRDGWFHTGDVGMLDVNGNLTILDRMTDMVISGGENIYCAEVEAALQQHDGIIEAAAFGVPDDRMGERLVAVVRQSDGAPFDERDLRLHLGIGLAGYKHPTEILVSSESLPRNAVGKVDKRALRARHAHDRSTSYAAT
jgi:long-chain acyl-CoA synthetase